MWKFLNKIIRELLFSTLAVEGGTCKHVIQRPFKLKRRKCRSGMRAADKFDYVSCSLETVNRRTPCSASGPAKAGSGQASVTMKSTADRGA